MYENGWLMKIEIGKLYENRTWKYLAPCLKFYGKDLETQLNTVFKLAIGIGDNLVERKEPCLYILCDSKYQETNFYRFLDWVRYQGYYITDYSYDPDLETKRKHMIVLRFPPEFSTDYKKFLDGKYSSMYPSGDKEMFFKDHPKALGVLNKTLPAFIEFIKIINKRYNVELGIQDYDQDKIEFDIPPEFNEEIFNYEVC